MQPDPNLNPAQPTTPTPTPLSAPQQAPQIIEPQAIASLEPATAIEPPVTPPLSPLEQSAAAPSPAIVPSDEVMQPEIAASTSRDNSAPLAPEVVPNVNMIQAQNINVSSSAAPKKGKRLKIIGGIVAAVVVLVVIGVVAIVALGGEQQIAYTSADITTVSAPSYSINRAKQWTDASINKTILNYLQSSLGAASSLTDQKIYTYKYDFKTNKGQTLMLVGDRALGVTDAQLQQGLKSSAAKQQFESGFKSLSNVLDSNSLCASVSGKNQSIKYDTSKFLVEVRSDVDCNYSAVNTSKFGTKGIHQSLFLGIKNGKTYLVSLVATQTDWIKNSSFYQDKIFNSVQPK